MPEIFRTASNKVKKVVVVFFQACRALWVKLPLALFWLKNETKLLPSKLTKLKTV